MPLVQYDVMPERCLLREFLNVVAGGNTVAVWVSDIDEAAVRNTADVDILIRR